MKSNLFFLLIFAISLSACTKAQNSSSTAPADPSSSRQSAPLNTFDYTQLRSATSGSCETGTFFFRFLSGNDAVIGKRDGQDIMESSIILIHPDQTFEVEIDEKYILSYSATGYSYKKQRSRYVAGRITEADGKLLLGDLMEIQGRATDQKTVVSVLYKKDVISAGLAGRSVTGHMVESSSAIMSVAEACPESVGSLGELDRFKAQPEKRSTALFSLASSADMQSNGIMLKKIELFLQPDGEYQVVGLVSLPGSKDLTNYILDSGEWKRSGVGLKLYHGNVKLLASNSVSLEFSSPVSFSALGNSHVVDLSGEAFTLSFGRSELTTDDLTDTLQ